MMLLIVNPVAGHGKAMRLADKASSLLGNCRTVYTLSLIHIYYS